MNLIVPIFYLILFSFLLTRIRWLGQAGFGKRFVVLLFAAKCLAGFAYNFIALHFLPHQGDIWPFFEDGKAMYQLFLHSPKAFFQTYGSIFHYSDLNATSTNSDFIRSAFEAIKLLHFVLNFFTLGNLWANTVWFNFGATLCFLYCWKFIKQQLAEQGLLAGLVFLLLPSLFFYSAGILKEGIVINLLAVLIPLSFELLTRFSFKIMIGWLAAFAILLIVKIFVAALWLACLGLWGLLLLFPTKQWRLTCITILISLPLFFYSSHFIPSVNLPAYLVQRQQEFLALPAGSAIYIEPLTPQPISYLKAVPIALKNVLFKPLPGEGGKALYSLYALEILLFWLGILYIIWKRSRQQLRDHQRSLAIVFLIFALFNLLFIGLIIPNIGSIIRYRSIFLPFVAVSILVLYRPRFISSKSTLFLEKLIAS